MKKILIIILMILFFAPFCGCGKDEQADNIGKAFSTYTPQTPEIFIDDSKIGSIKSDPRISDDTLEYVKSFRLGPYQTDQYATGDELVYCHYYNEFISFFCYRSRPLVYPKKSFEVKTEQITIKEALDIVNASWGDVLESEGYVCCPDDSYAQYGLYHFIFKKFYKDILLDTCTIDTDYCGNIISFLRDAYNYDMESFDIPANLEETLVEAGKKFIEADAEYQKSDEAQGIASYDNLTAVNIKFGYSVGKNSHGIFYRLQFDPTFSDGRPQEYGWKTKELVYLIGKKGHPNDHIWLWIVGAVIVLVIIVTSLYLFKKKKALNKQA